MGFPKKILGGLFIDMSKQMKCREIVNKAANRIVKERINQNKVIFNKKMKYHTIKPMSNVQDS